MVAKKIRNCILLLLACIVGGYLLLVLAYLLPTDAGGRIVRHASRAAETVGETTSLIPGYDGTMPDNFTNGLMLNIAVAPKNGNAFASAALTSRFLYEKTGSRDSFVQYYTKGGSTDYTLSPYINYWHGYLIFLKPLLYLTRYGTIQSILLLFQLLCAGGILIYLAGKKKTGMAIAFLLLTFYLLAFIFPLSMQLSACWNVLLVSLCVYFAVHEKKKDYSWLVYFFFLTGIATAYFDLLTYPLITLGVPCAVVMADRCTETAPAGKKLLSVVAYALEWGAGYILMWMGKPLVTTAVTGKNAFATVAEQILFRTGVSEQETVAEETSPLLALSKNIGEYLRPSFLIPLVILLVILIIRIFAAKKKKIHLDAAQVLPFLLIMLMPFVWYAAASNHSTIHYWYTFRELGIAVFAAAVFALLPISGERKEKC